MALRRCRVSSKVSLIVVALACTISARKLITRVTVLKAIAHLELVVIVVHTQALVARLWTYTRATSLIPITVLTSVSEFILWATTVHLMMSLVLLPSRSRELTTRRTISFPNVLRINVILLMALLHIHVLKMTRHELKFSRRTFLMGRKHTPIIDT